MPKKLDKPKETVVIRLTEETMTIIRDACARRSITVNTAIAIIVENCVSDIKDSGGNLADYL